MTHPPVPLVERREANALARARDARGGEVVRLAAWASGAGLCGVLLAGSIETDALSPVQAVVGYSGALLALTVGVLVWQRRPDSRTGILLTTFVLAGLLADLPHVFDESTLAVTLGFALIQVAPVLFAHVVLSYPSGRLDSRVERIFIASGYVFAALYGLTFLLFYSPRAPSDPNVWECPDCAVPLTHVVWADVRGTVRVLDAVLGVLGVIFLVLLVRKLVRATPRGRRVVLPLLTAAFALVAQFIVQLAVFGSAVNTWTHRGWFWVVWAAVIFVPLALAAGLLWGRTERSAVADLVVALERTPPGSVRDALARTLGDPTLMLALWLPEQRSYVDSKGRPVELPRPNTGRAVTVLGSAEAPVAALVHDPALLERRALLDAAGAAARLALENERLQAELRAQLVELRASRARIVGAGDEERRRLERNLHDGAQQRLLGLGLALQLAQTQLGADATGASQLLAEAEGQLRAAIDELRELARGIHPAILTDQGLAAALRSLAERAPVPVTLGALPEERLGDGVEAAAYFLVSEALANVAKHARATSVDVSVTCRARTAIVDIEDDGIGGATSDGSGLRGLVDRVQALDGALTIDSPRGGGTRIHAEIPCAS